MTRLFDKFARQWQRTGAVRRQPQPDPGSILRTSATGLPPQSAPDFITSYTITLVGAVSGDDPAVVARSRLPGADALQVQATGLNYPAMCIRFRTSRCRSRQTTRFMATSRRGAASSSFGTIAVRGERNTLVVSQDSLSRLSYNPFLRYMAVRIVAQMPLAGTGRQKVSESRCGIAL
jgi:hypothetical protein